MDRFDPILALLLSPFVATCCVLLAIAVTYVARIERRQK